MNAFETINAIEIDLIYCAAAIEIFIAFRIIDFHGMILNFLDMIYGRGFILGTAISAVLEKFNHNQRLTLCAVNLECVLGSNQCEFGRKILQSVSKILNEKKIFAATRAKILNGKEITKLFAEFLSRIVCKKNIIYCEK
jgi:ABC-type uncharacterized transport system permease subunit